MTPPLGRGASAALCFAVAAIVGYAALRLAAAVNEPDPRTLGPSVHVGYYWRVATSLWWGGLAALAGWRWPAVGRYAGAAVLPVVIASTVAAALVP